MLCTEILGRVSRIMTSKDRTELESTSDTPFRLYLQGNYVVGLGISIVLISLSMFGCQGGNEPQTPTTPLPADTLHPATTAVPVLTVTPLPPVIYYPPKVIDGWLDVKYYPLCEAVPRPATWVAPIVVTDLYSQSTVYLRGNGVVKGKPNYKTEDGRMRLEAALRDSSVMEQVLTRPYCPYN